MKGATRKMVLRGFPCKDRGKEGRQQEERGTVLHNDSDQQKKRSLRGTEVELHP